MEKRTHRKYPLPTPAERRRERLFLLLFGVPFCAAMWFLMGWDFWRRLRALIG
jgi:hypothetical protein